MAHSLAHKKVQNRQLKQRMQCMQCKLFLGNLVLVDLKRVIDTVGVWGSNPHAPTIVFNNLARFTAFSVTPDYAISDGPYWSPLLCIATQNFRWLSTLQSNIRSYSSLWKHHLNDSLLRVSLGSGFRLRIDLCLLKTPSGL